MHDTRSIPAGVWTELTDGDTSSITVQNVGDYDLWLQRSGASAPASRGGGLLLKPGVAVLNEDLSDLAPGSSGSRVWAWCDARTQAAVSHP